MKELRYWINYLMLIFPIIILFFALPTLVVGVGTLIESGVSSTPVILLGVAGILLLISIGIIRKLLRLERTRRKLIKSGVSHTAKITGITYDKSMRYKRKAGHVSYNPIIVSATYKDCNGTVKAIQSKRLYYHLDNNPLHYWATVWVNPRIEKEVYLQVFYQAQ